MRIAVTMQSIRHLGGIGTYTQRLLPEMLDLDRENEYVLVYPSFGKAATVMGGEFSARENVSEVYSSSLVPHGLWWDQMVVPGLVSKLGINAFFNPFQSVPIRGLFPKTCTLHNSEWFVMPEVFGLVEKLNGRHLLPRVMRAADKIISVSQKIADELAAAAGLPTSRFVVIHNAASDDFFPVEDPAAVDQICTKYKLPDEFVLFVGGIYPQKNFKGLLLAWKQVASELPHQLVVAGHERWKSKADIGLIDELGLRDRVTFLGWVDNADLPVLYSLAACFAIVSFHESSSIALHEAMRCGCPIVASDAGGNPEVVGDAGPCVDPNDIEAIAGALLDIAGNPQRQRELGARSIERSKLFTWRKAAEATLEVVYGIAR